MHAMPELQGVASGRTLSAGAMLVFGAGFALYQLTSLMLGPVSSRQLDLSLTIPGVDGQDLSEPLAPNVMVVVGMRTMPATPSMGADWISRSSRVSSTPTPAGPSRSLPIVVPKPEPAVVPKPGPVVVPKPDPTAGPKPESPSDASQLDDND
jgi:hypothetical protein